MELDACSPVCFSLRCFNTPQPFSRFRETKTQYTYKLMIVTKGFLRFELNGRLCLCQNDSLVYLTPGDHYRMTDSSDSFELYNLYFHYLPLTPPSPRKLCLFAQEYRAENCMETVDFPALPILSHSFVLKGTGIVPLLREYNTLTRVTDPLDLAYRASLFKCLLLRLAREARHFENSRENQLFSRKADEILDYIRIHCTESPDGTALSRALGYHPNHINHILKEAVGMTLTETIRRAKTELACSLLQANDTPLTDIAQRLGYCDYSHFSKNFRKETGMTPRTYRLSAHEENSRNSGYSQNLSHTI